MNSFPGAVPSPRQLAWHDLEYYGFVHFTVNTFTGREWGMGDKSPAVFHPTDFSADQIAETASLGGMKGLILTAKHHDGFCLWPSDHTGHSVKSSPWRDGRGDVVGDLARACQERGLRFGVYLSPWDRHHVDYGRPAYLAYYRAQLRELLTRYGPIFEVWFDLANGGDGCYGGVYERRLIDARTYYEWEETYALVRQLQPTACMFNGPDIRWVGNEAGAAGDPCWHTFDPARQASPDEHDRQHGHRGGALWLPAECDVSIRPGWFYHAEEDVRVRSVGNLMELYFQSVGHGANLLLNLPPDRRGRIPERDAAALREFCRERERLYACNLAAQPAADLGRVGGWSAGEGQAGSAFEIRFERPVAVNVVSLREDLALGQRVGEFALDAREGEAWREVYRGQSIGNRRLVRLPDLTARALRLRITRAAAAPALREIGVYHWRAT